MPCTILYLDVDTFDCAVGRIGAPIRQLRLWDAGSYKSRKLQDALDSLYNKYDRDVISKGK